MRRIRNVACLAASWAMGGTMLGAGIQETWVVVVVTMLVAVVCMWYTKESAE